mgnify:CR=1 FL=1
MNVIITPHTLQGTVEAPSSKSIGHRDLICAALAEGESLVDKHFLIPGHRSDV